VKGTRAITMEERMMHAIALPRRQRKRIRRLGLEMELFR